MQKISYGDDVWVLTFLGWEKFDWDSPVFETAEDAIESFSLYSTITKINPSKGESNDRM